VNQRTTNETGQRLRAWLRTRLGRLLIQRERELVASALEDVFGFQLLQIGAWGESGRFFEAARTQRQWVVASSPEVPADVRCKTSELAIASDSVDAILLPHTLEFESDPHAVLREVERVLVSEGQLLVLGFSPVGTWALRHRLSEVGFPPGLARFISERRLRDWLALGYLFRLPIPPRGPFESTESIPDPRGLLPANAYLLKARKRVYALTPVRLKKRERLAIVGGLEPTTRLRA
jgi:SAM-dependent methyltransferase